MVVGEAEIEFLLLGSVGESLGDFGDAVNKREVVPGEEVFVLRVAVELKVVELIFLLHYLL